MSNKYKVLAAVEHSIRRDAIGHVAGKVDALEVLSILHLAGYDVEDYTETQDFLDVWGLDESGDPWRIVAE
jgi:hypothetical protein